MSDPKDMCQCQVTNCGFVYDPKKPHRKAKENLGVKFHTLPAAWKCPVCGASKDTFRPVAGPGSVLEENK